MAVVGIIPAAGSGERLGASGPKAFADCAGRPLVDWSVDVLAEVCARVVLAVPAGYEDGEDRVRGGPSRSASVRNVLAAAPEATVAVVHDAARPLVTEAIVRACIAEIEEGWDAAIAATPVTDTIKEADADGQVRLTLERRHLWAVQTPQAFEAGILRRALEADPEAIAAATDDASLVEAAGGSVRVVEAPAENLKVTIRLDLLLAEALLEARARA